MLSEVVAYVVWEVNGFTQVDNLQVMDVIKALDNK